MYDQIASNKRKTWLLIIGFCVLVIAPWAIYGYFAGEDMSSQIIVATVIATSYSLISYFISDKVALATNGAKQIKKQDAPELWNLVENLCIANGQPVPKIYIVDDPSPNAFATGRKPETASIAFTTGILRLLEKKELEGVIAHELSHIRNYDVRVMTIVVVLVGAIMLLADIFLRSLFFSGGRDRDRGGNALAILALVGIALSILSPILAQIIQFAVSRSREYLADASGALLTRYPEGLAAALEKIGTHGGKLERANHATAHLFIANPFGPGRGIGGLFATHPPLDERIARLRKMGA